jgi:glycosyltransferase involved in cell wall biosynthesis
MGKSGNPARQQLKGTISWYSNSPAMPTGYGTQTAQVMSRLKRDGFDVAGLSNFGVEGLATEWDSGYGKVKVYQRGADLYSNDMIGVHHKKHRGEHPNQADLLVTLYDVWVLVAPSLNDLPVASWIPIDHNPVPPKVVAFAQKPNVTPIAMSRFGQRALEAAGVKAHYIPHAFEKVFEPTTHFEGLPVREYTQWGDKFVVGMNAANKAGNGMHRKAFAENFRAFADFAKDKDDVLLYVHSDWIGAYGGWNLSDLAVACGIPKEKLLFVDPIEYRYGINSKKLAALYSGMDVLLSANYGEGFGIPQIEAQACGTPIITSNSCASPELASPDSFIVSGQYFWDDPQKSWFHVPFIHDITAALQTAYDRGRKDFPATIEFASQYAAEKVYQEHWLPLLKELLPQ